MSGLAPRYFEAEIGRLKDLLFNKKTALRRGPRAVLRSCERFLGAVHSVVDQFFHNGRIRECRDITQRAIIIFSDLAQNTAHDFA